MNIVNSLAWGILASRSGRLGYILGVSSHHLSSICLPVWKDLRMLSLTISPVPQTHIMKELRVMCLKPISLTILTILFWNYFCCLSVPYLWCSRNLGALSNSPEAKSLMTHKGVTQNEWMNPKPGSWCMTLEFGRITLATLNIIDEIHDGGVWCVSSLITICVTVLIHSTPPPVLETLPIVCGRNCYINIRNRNLTSVELVNGETLVWHW